MVTVLATLKSQLVLESRFMQSLKTYRFMMLRQFGIFLDVNFLYWYLHIILGFKIFYWHVPLPSSVSNIRIIGPNEPCMVQISYQNISNVGCSPSLLPSYSFQSLASKLVSFGLSPSSSDVLLILGCLCHLLLTL